MPDSPTKVAIRMFNVRFGDCFRLDLSLRQAARQELDAGNEVETG